MVYSVFPTDLCEPAIRIRRPTLDALIVRDLARVDEDGDIVITELNAATAFYAMREMELEELQAEARTPEEAKLFELAMMENEEIANTLHYANLRGAKVLAVKMY